MKVTPRIAAAWFLFFISLIVMCLVVQMSSVLLYQYQHSTKITATVIGIDGSHKKSRGRRGSNRPLKHSITYRYRHQDQVINASSPKIFVLSPQVQSIIKIRYLEENPRTSFVDDPAYYGYAWDGVRFSVTCILILIACGVALLPSESSRRPEENA